MKIKKKWILSLLALILFILIVWTLWANTALEVNEYEIVSDRIPHGFDGFRIAQISDLHNAEFGERNEKLIQLLSQTDPDIIVITGDLIDSRHTDIEIALDFARLAVKLAPVYYVSGNHEARVREYEDLKMGLAEAGVVILENQKARITREGESITLMGIDDPSFQEDYLFGDSESVARQAIENLQDIACFLSDRLSKSHWSFIPIAFLLRHAIELTLKCMLLSRTAVNVEECVQRHKRKSHILYMILFHGNLSYVNYKTISKVPAAIRAQPAMDLRVNCSCRISAASIIVITTLSLSMGTTLEAPPN